MIHTVFQAEKKYLKITAEELEKQTAKILPRREELAVMDYSTLNMPYYPYTYPEYGNYGNFNTINYSPYGNYDPYENYSPYGNYSSYGNYDPYENYAPTNYIPNDYQQIDYAQPTYYQPNYVQPNTYDWRTYANVYAYGNYPDHTPTTPNCNIDVYSKMDNEWDTHDKSWDYDVDENNHTDNFDNWQYKAYIYTNPHYNNNA